MKLVAGGEMKFRGVGCFLVVVPFGLSFQARDLRAQEYRPFTDVPNVCPDCEPDKYDRIRLENGKEVRAWVVAENSIFYVLERHGELRAIARKLVENVKRSPLRSDRERAEMAKAHRDQIVFKDGHVISGKIQKFREDTGMYDLRSAAGIDHLAYRVVIRMVVEDGKLTFGTP